MERRIHTRKPCDVPAVLWAEDGDMALGGVAVDISEGGFRLVSRPWILTGDPLLPWLDELFGQRLMLCFRGDVAASSIHAMVAPCWRKESECGLRIVACMPYVRDRIERVLQEV